MHPITAGQVVDEDGTKVHHIQLYGKWLGAASLGAFIIIFSAITAAKLTLNANKYSPTAV